MEKEGINVKKIMAEERWNKRNARAYERYRKLAPGDEEQFWEGALVEASMDQNAVILDLGTGTGFLARIILKQGLNVLGLDLSRNMLAIAKKNAPDATLVRGDAERIPLKDNSVDLIVSRWVLWTLPHPGSALEEVVRVLKPDGRVMLCDGDSKNATKHAAATIPGGIRSCIMDIVIGWRLPRWKRVYGKLNPHLPRWGHEEISCKLRELGIEETTVVHNINRRKSPLQRLFSHSGWEQFIVIFNNGR
ncbi:MAG: class I SAM-dependent methyltransferase [Euryarchaeota archaeon]|nr:class I SAM-dependent methyltransferase [Euryarchaeota archaeon]